jgi:hypothetical protein
MQYPLSRVLLFHARSLGAQARKVLSVPRRQGQKSSWEDVFCSMAESGGAAFYLTFFRSFSFQCLRFKQFILPLL